MYTLTKSQPDLAINMIEECLIIAGGYYGSVFGGYVRDVIVPRSYNPKCNVEFKDVDLWFTNQKDADNFVEAMGKSFVFGIEVDYPPMYKFLRQRYVYFQHKLRSLGSI